MNPLNLHRTHGEQLFISCSAVGYVSQQSSCWDMFYMNRTKQANLSLCALRKYDFFGLELAHWRRKPQKSSCMYHSPVPCPVCVVSVGGPSEPPPLDVWSGLMFTVLLTECWRIWADKSPQCSLRSHVPSVGRHLWRGWANALLLASLCLALSFINTVAGANTSGKAGFSQRSNQCISTNLR